MTGPTDTMSGSDDPGYYEALGRAIRVLRTERGLERKELAEASGLSYPYLSEIETGRKRPSSKALFVIAEALGVRPSALLTLADRYGGRMSPEASATFVAPPVVPPGTPAPVPPSAAAPSLAAIASPPASPPAAAPEPAAVRARAAPSGGWRWFERGPARSGGSPPAPAQRLPAEETELDRERARLLDEMTRTSAELSNDDLAALLDIARRLAR